MRPTDVIPKVLVDELLRLGRIDKDWIRVERLEGSTYRASSKYPTWLKFQLGGDTFAMYALSRWLVDGPKTFVPSKEQCGALERIDVRLKVEDFSSPYPAIMVKVDYPPFTGVIVCKNLDIISCCLHTPDHVDDIVTTIGTPDGEIEDSLRRFDDDCSKYAAQAHLALRVACNACLALSSYGCHAEYLYPKEVERDQKTLRKRPDLREGAQRRIALAPQVVSFNQEVTLCRREQGESTGTGSEVATHWRRGHWHTVCHGTGRSLRKLKLYPPVLVRSDKFVGDLADTSVTIK